jgi:two-component system chemotaxis sensor kinase CheA
MGTDMSQYLEVFNTEATELLDKLNQTLLLLEKSPEELKFVEELFRIAHTLKGMSAAMGFKKVAGLTHHMEDVLDKVRKKKRPISQRLIDLLFRCLDALQELLESGDENSFQLETVLAELKSEQSWKASQKGKLQKFWLKVYFEKDCSLPKARAYLVLKRISALATIDKSNFSDFDEEAQPRFLEILVSSSLNQKEFREVIGNISEIDQVEVVEIEDVDKEEEKKPKLSLGKTIRVKIDNLDHLLDLVGELVINRTRMETILATDKLDQLPEVIDDLKTILANMQREILQVRMVPVSYIFNRFPRVVRDIARKLNKKVSLIIEGQDIELDRIVLDEISEPLLHLLRNAIDHGIESRKERIKAGKPEEGVIRLAAYRGRGSVYIEVSDDGQGIDPAKIRDIAVRKGFISPEEAATLSDEASYHLLCQPGFTTQQKATDVSGWGVGLDAVKDKVEALGGLMQIRSDLGKGSRFILELPLTLALIPALLVKLKQQIFAIPLSNVVHIAHLSELNLKRVGRKDVTIIHEEVIPVASWGLIFEAPVHYPKRGYVVVLQIGGVKRALIVEEVLGNQEIVVKPLSGVIQGIRSLAGATVLGNGRVALIIDPRSLYEEVVGKEPKRCSL